MDLFENGRFFKTAAVLAIAVCIALCGILTGMNFVDTEIPEPEVTQQPATQRPVHSQENEQEPIQETPKQPVDAVSLQENCYTLILIGDELVVCQNVLGVQSEMLRINVDRNALPKDEVKELESGIEFSTLQEIDAYIEGAES